MREEAASLRIFPFHNKKGGRQAAPAFFVNLPPPQPFPGADEGGRVYTETERLCGLWAADLGRDVA